MITAVRIGEGKVIIEADFVQMLWGDAAVKAARKDGEAEAEIGTHGDTIWSVPNDYYVVNESRRLRTFTLSADAKIMMVMSGTSALSKSTIAKLKSGFKDKLFRLSIGNGEVTRIEEIYTP